MGQSYKQGIIAVCSASEDGELTPVAAFEERRDARKYIGVTHGGKALGEALEALDAPSCPDSPVMIKLYKTVGKYCEVNGEKLDPSIRQDAERIEALRALNIPLHEKADTRSAVPSRTGEKTFTGHHELSVNFAGRDVPFFSKGGLAKAREHFIAEDGDDDS